MSGDHDWQPDGTLLRCTRCGVCLNPQVLDVPTFPACTPASALEEPEPMELPGRLALITCYYNWAGWQALRRNYLRFVRSCREWPVDLFVAEVALGTAPFLDQAAFLRLRAGPEHILWQKERLLNLLVERLPAEYDKIAWIDADVVFLDPYWTERVCAVLTRWPVVQLWRQWHCADAWGRVGEVLHCVGHRAARWLSQQSASPGGAWAARRDVFPLYDRHILGAGDATALAAWTRQIERFTWLMPPRLQTHFVRWAEDAYRKVQGQITHLPGDLVHFYHGTRANRRYLERWEILTAHNYDPTVHVTLDDQGLLCWTSAAPAGLRQGVAEYFLARQEDDAAQTLALVAGPTS